MEPDVHDVFNLAGLCGILMFKIWQCANFQFLSENRPMGIGQFWVPVSAVGHKWSNFQPFGFNIGLCTWFLDISTCKTWKSNLGICLGPFWGYWPFFWAAKLIGLVTMEPALKYTWNLTGFCCIMMSKMWQYANFLYFFCKWGNFGSQKVRSVLNIAIFNHFASNLDCAHDFKIFPPAKEERPIAANLCPFLGSIFSPNFFFWQNIFFYFFDFLQIFYSTISVR